MPVLTNPSLRRRLCCCHAHLHPAVGFLHQTGQEGIHEVCAEDWGKTFPPVRRCRTSTEHVVIIRVECERITSNHSPLQATAFLLCGFLVMIGSMTLIVLDWVHNATASPDKHADGH